MEYLVPTHTILLFLLHSRLMKESNLINGLLSV